LFELVEGNMAFTAFGKELVAFLKVLVDQCGPREFDGALTGERFIMLYRLGATEYDYR